MKIPEGPELAYARDRLKILLSRKRITDMSIGMTGRYTKKSPEGFDRILSLIKSKGRGPLVTEVSTHGKFMWWKFMFDDDSVSWYMHCTYGMSGGWYKSPSKHTAFVMEYAAGDAHIIRETHNIFFNDPRHFGTLKFVQGDALHTKKLATLGPCILSSGVTPELFSENALCKPTRTISEALMDQSCLAGVGNYLKAEALYRSGISPWRCVTDLSASEYVDLTRDVVDVATESYRSQGATISTYRTVDGQRGTTQFDFRIYSRKQCPKGHIVTREQTPEGRTSHWCKQCQK